MQPPDVPTLTWGRLMGDDEAMVLDAAERMLESALDAGAFTPGGPGWRTTRNNLIETWLSTPCSLFGGRAPVDVVHTERAARWADEGSPARREILRTVLASLAAPAERAADGPTGSTIGAVEPLRFLLDTIRGGCTLTATGRLPPALVRDTAARFGWGMPAFTIRHEGNVVELVELRDLATRARLILFRRRQRRLVLTPAGHAALDDPAQLWKAATTGWFDYDVFATGVAEIAAALLLARPADVDDLTNVAHDAIAPDFRDRDGNHPDRRDTRTALWEWLRPGHALGWLRYPHGIDEQLYRLTDPGRAAAVDGLRHRSHAPASPGPE